MTITASYFDHAKYPASEFRNRDKDFIGNGVLKPTTDFALTYPGGLVANPAAGTAWVDGYRIGYDASPVQSLTFAAANATLPRIDLIEIGYSGTGATGAGVIKIVTGVAAASPIQPQPDAGYIALFAVNIAAAATAITGANVTDLRAAIVLSSGIVLGAGAATDLVIGNRTTDPTLANPASTGTLTQLLSWITGRIKAILGTTNWFDAPPTTLTAANTHMISTSNPHSVTAAQAGAVPAGGGTMTGPLILSADPTLALGAATKQYVDATAQGLSVKQSVRAATTGSNITLSGTQTIDGIALNVGDRTLIKDQTDQTTNGIYVVAAVAWARSTDANTAALLAGMFTFIEQGTVNAASGWVLPLNAITLGTTALVYTQFSGAGEIIVGAGLTKTGNTLAVIPATVGALGGVKGSTSVPVASDGTLSATQTSIGMAGANTFTGAQTAPTFTSNAATGTVPLTVTSTTKVTNLNSDLIDGYDTSQSATANTVAVRDANGNVVSNYPVSGQNPNLLFNPSFNLGSAGWTGIGSNGFNVVFGTHGEGSYLNNTTSPTGPAQIISNFIPMGTGITVTLSAEVFTGGLSTANCAYFNVYAFNGTTGISGVTVFVPPGLSWTKYSATFTIPANTIQIQIACGFNIAGTNTNTAWRKIKLEYGSVATTYSDDNTLNLIQYANVLPLAQKCASVSELAITTTSQTMVAQFQPVYNGNYETKAYLRVTTACNVTIMVAWVDASTSIQTNYFINNQSLTVGAHSFPAVFLNVLSTAAITLYVTASVANAVYASASILAV
ncbi:MAG: beta strand repeat-containing protein [Desulfitobacteriaceae bacterium]